MFYAPIDSTDAGDRVTRELRVGAVPGFMGAFVLLDGVGKGRGRKSQGEKLFKKTALDSLLSFPSSMFIFPGLIQSLLYFYCYDTLHYRAIALTDCQEEKVAKFALLSGTC